MRLRRLFIAVLVLLWLLHIPPRGTAQDAGDSGPRGPGAENGRSVRARKRPNIIVILSDDHRHDYFSGAGHSFVRTPALDRLAGEGVRFTNAFVTTSLCSPSRASFLTGQYASTHGVRNNFTPWNPAKETFIETLADSGYAGAFIGKWHMPGGLPDLDGLDEFVSFTAQDGQGVYYNCPLVVNGRREESRVPYLTTELTNRAIDFVREHEAEPFVLYLSHKAAHANFLPAREFEGIYDHVHVPAPDRGHPWIQASKGQMNHGMLRPLPALVRDYAETITSMDAEIGRLLDTLDELELTGETMVIYTSDNGYMWGEHGLVDKRWAYETSIRIPWILRYPPLTDTASAGGSRAADAVTPPRELPPRELPQMVLNIDLAPTLLDLAGLPVPESMQGESLLPYLRNPGAAGREAFLYEYFLDFPFPVPPLQAVRTREHKLVDYDSRRRDELFDLREDPGERDNLLRRPSRGSGSVSPSARADRLRRELEGLADAARRPGAGEESP